MLNKKTMYHLLLTVLCSLSAVCSSCDSSRDLPDNPDVDFVRYTKDLSFQSKLLGMSIQYSIYLPANYTRDKAETYGVVYLLHGYGDNNNSWNDQYLQVTSSINALEDTGTISPMIYVMPQGFKSYYVDKFDGTFNYMKMFVDELVPYIDKLYRTKADKEHRAVVGYSMGGFGAMVLPSMNPSVFSVSVPLSMSFRTDAQYTTEAASGWDNQWGSIFGGAGLTGTARLTDYYKSLCPLHFFTKESASIYSGINYFLDCGDDEEQLSVGNDELHILMRDLGIPHEYRVRDGAHTSSYWRSAMNEVLTFIESCFQGYTYTNEDLLTVDGIYSGTLENKVIDGVKASVFLPAGYDAIGTTIYPTCYLVHDGLSTTDEQKIMSLLNDVQKTAPSIFISFDYKALADKSFKDWISNVETAYRTGGSTAKRVALGVENGGKYIFEATNNSQEMLKSLFLFDASIDNSPMTPNKSTFYYIDITDGGTHYKGANALYLKCRKDTINHEYRVRNGLDSYQSFLSGLKSIEQLLLNNLKN
jgi:enterochelin esterase-like enzyme